MQLLVGSLDMPCKEFAIDFFLFAIVIYGTRFLFIPGTYGHCTIRQQILFDLSVIHVPLIFKT